MKDDKKDKPIKRYLKVTPSSNKNYDAFYYQLDPRDTWENALDYIESELDAQYLENNESILGVKLTVEIVGELPEGIEEGK